ASSAHTIRLPASRTRSKKWVSSPPTAANARKGGEPAAASAEATTAPTHGAQYRGGATQHTAIQQREPGAAQRPGGSDQDRRPAKRPPSRRQRARRRTVLVLLAILLLGLLTGYGAWYLAVGRYHQVPNVSGQAQAAAVRLLRGDGFAVNPVADQAFSESVPSGAVVSTHPGAGAHLLSGKSVQLVVSKGAERYQVPAVAGKSYPQAQQAFASIPVRLNRSDITDDSGKFAAGQVIRTNPAAGGQLTRDAEVTVYVSTGPPIVAVPGVTGQTQADANSTLIQASFKVQLSQDFSTTVPAGSVISQDPIAGASVAKFSTVNLVISKGPPLVTLPSIPNGTSADDARRTLEALNLKVKIKKAFGGFLNKVVGMDPAAGAQVPVGSQVVLTVV
ncbi:MAG: PASTA domain-containing protein, partial [Jatrophihabitans sp.]